MPLTTRAIVSMDGTALLAKNPGTAPVNILWDRSTSFLNAAPGATKSEACMRTYASISSMPKVKPGRTKTNFLGCRDVKKAAAL